LSGEGLTYQWTRRALERAGFAIITENTAIHIEVVDQNTWKLHHSDSNMDYHSLYGLITSLNVMLHSSRHD
jgi:hypothetical protein